MLDLIGKVFSKSRNDFVRNGALFQLTQVVYHHIFNLYGGGPKVLGIEQKRPAYKLVNNLRIPNNNPYKREIDIVLAGADNTEHWIEVKSLAKSSFKQSKFKPTLAKGSGYYRQFFHDMRLNDDFIHATNKPKILEGKTNGVLWVGNSNYSWHFQQFSAGTSGIPPDSTDEKNVRKWLCIPHTKNKDYFASNLNDISLVIRSRCNDNKGNIKLRNTQSYVKDVLKKYAVQLDIEEFVSIIETLPD